MLFKLEDVQYYIYLFFLDTMSFSGDFFPMRRLMGVCFVVTYKLDNNKAFVIIGASWIYMWVTLQASKTAKAPHAHKRAPNTR